MCQYKVVCIGLPSLLRSGQGYFCPNAKPFSAVTTGQASYYFLRVHALQFTKKHFCQTLTLLAGRICSRKLHWLNLYSHVQITIILA